MISGVDYIFLSNIPPNNVEPKFILQLQLLWKKPVLEEFDRLPAYIEMFFAKNKMMSKLHERKGFFLDRNREGCFIWCARKIPLLEGKIKVIKWQTPKEMKNIAPYNNYLVLEDVWEYTLVLPASIQESQFCHYIHKIMLGSLSIKS